MVASTEDRAARPRDPPRGWQDPAQDHPKVVSVGDDFPSHHPLESITLSHHLLKSLPLPRSHASLGVQAGANSATVARLFPGAEEEVCYPLSLLRDSAI